MAKVNAPYVTFAGGEIGAEAMARVSLENYSAMSEVLENWLPEVAGPMILRPGFQFLVEPTADHAYCRLVPFVFSVRQKYLLVFSAGEMRVVQNGGIVARPDVSSVVANGTFPTLASWTSISVGGGSAAGSASGLLLTSNGVDRAGVRQQVSTDKANTHHALNIDVTRGPVSVAIGSTAGDHDILATTQLRTGVHSLQFTPTGSSYWIDLWATADVRKIVKSIAVSAGGDMVLTTPWDDDAINAMMYEQSTDVLYVATGTGPRYRVERHSSGSWSLVQTLDNDGPFLTLNLDEAVTVTPSVISGNGTLTANQSLFSEGHVGALWKITHTGQLVQRSVNGGGQWSDPVKFTGTTRSGVAVISGTWAGTVRVQQSVGDTESWTDFATYTANTGGSSITDTLTNQEVYYRIGIQTGEYTSGTATVQLSYAGGVTDGICRIIGYTSPTSVSMEVLETFGRVAASAEWYEGAWSDKQGWPTCLALFDGRLWSGYADRISGSKSDGYETLKTGDQADDAVDRSIGTGRVNPVVAIIPLSRLQVLTDGAEVELRSSTFDEPITPTNLTVRNIATRGATAVQPIIVDTRGIYVSRAGTRAVIMSYDVNSQSYQSSNLMRTHKQIGWPGLTQMAVSREPDTRVWIVRADGQVLVKLFDPAENVLGWSRVITDGVIESVAVLPGDDEDEVYFMVARTVGGNTVRYLEKLSSVMLDDAADATQVDSFVQWSGAATTTIPGFGHLAGRTVTVFADGAAQTDAVVAADGTITLRSPKSRVVAGLKYEGRYMSSKLALGAQMGTALGQYGKPLSIVVLLFGSMGTLEYGQTFEKMDALKDRDIEGTYDSGPALHTGHSELLKVPGTLKGDFTRDPRVCLRASSPFWVQIYGFVIGNQVNERVS